MNKKNFCSSINLSTHIRKAIGYRILFCFIAAMVVILIITINDIISSSHQLEKNLEEQCSNLESFVIRQVLVKNEDSIKPKIDDLNQKSNIIKFMWNNKEKTAPQKNLQWSFPFSWIYTYPIKYIDGTELGTIIVKGSIFYDLGLFSDLLTKLALLLLFFVTIFIVLYPLSKRIPQQLFITPIDNLLFLLRNEKSKMEPTDLPNLPSEIKEIRDKITTLLKSAEERSREAALGQIATQVAHDIRSPLLVLNVETDDLFSIPEKKRIAIRGAIQRVNDIANNLLSQYKQEKTKIANTSTPSPEPVALMLDSIVSEKRVQASNLPIQIELETCQDANALFINVDIPSFKRALSNIINNSIEAIKDNGLIIVKLGKKKENIIISIIDNGCGIPNHLLPAIMKAGTSFGKIQGSGLGLSYAISNIYTWSGNYSITSQTNKGTTFEITLPQARPPSWFTHEINIFRNSTLVVLDDDDFIHSIWDKKISGEFIKLHNINLIHFYSPDELINYCNRNQNSPEINYLLDYELAGYKETGLTLAKMLGITSQTTLVTSRYEAIDIRENCQRLSIKIIPKLLVMDAHIKILENNELVFIDDDETITRIWENRAELSNKKIAVFNDFYDFKKVSNSYKKDTLIYIDSSLGGNLKGEIAAKDLYDSGYQNIYIATGYNKENFKDIYWVKDIVDKSPPF
ncbi:MAG: HAMP domain-containing histidine kinase [Gammaproteobacteria bacterium]|nr:MAG: HAMP domain-containing histidine kinase [Gammaproteobacteria bacterium]